MFAWVLATPNAAMLVLAGSGATALQLTQADFSLLVGDMPLNFCHRGIFRVQRLHHDREYSEVKDKV